jgi:hypothetical protein
MERYLTTWTTVSGVGICSNWNSTNNITIQASFIRTLSSRVPIRVHAFAETPKDVDIPIGTAAGNIIIEASFKVLASEYNAP